MIHQIEYNGKWLSLNEVYSKNRFLASKTKKEWKERFTLLFTEAGVTPFTKFFISLKYWSRIDVDNTTAGNKVGIDTLREMGLVANDDKRFYRGLFIQPVPTMKHNSYSLTIYTDADCTEVLAKINDIL